jgi:hypothetical protein
VAQLAQGLLERGGARRVTDAAALARVLETLGTDAAAVARVGALAAAAVAAEQGALARHLDIVLPRLAAMAGRERGREARRSGNAGAGASGAGAGDGM